MLGLLARKLEVVEFLNTPTDARSTLRSRLRTQYLFTLGMTAELFRVLADFDNSGIQTLLVKGPVTSLLAFNDPAARSFVDLDLLVRQSQVIAAAHRMIDLGFQPQVPLAAIDAGRVPGEYLFHRPDTRHMIELHTERTFRYYPRAMRIEDLFARSRRLELDGRSVPVLSLEDEFVLNAIHGAKHFWERLIWVADIAAIVARHPEMQWSNAVRFAEDVGAARMLRVTLLLAEQVLEVPVPPEMAAFCNADRTALQLTGQIRNWLPHAGYAPPPIPRRALFRARIAGGGISGNAYLLRLSFSPTEEDWSDKRHQGSRFAEVLGRPFRLYKKYGPGNNS